MNPGAREEAKLNKYGLFSSSLAWYYQNSNLFAFEIPFSEPILKIKGKCGL